MRIQSLLNPLCGEQPGYRSSESPTPASLPRSIEPITSVPKRQKIPKDAPIFCEGNKIVGHVNYPPYEAGDDNELAAQHRKFQIYPMGEIFKKGVRHIPYNSDKKDFLDKTGRDAFEMFQYTYKVPGDDSNKEYVVVWDYNVGLVRMTPFFKSCKYSKTIPAKAMRENPGLKEICYSITGGALVCQGYWMPYQAAKAIAATFCFDIRWALTPVFGNDFPEMCLSHKDPNFAKFLISPAIVRKCTDETKRFRSEGVSYKIRPTTSAIAGQTPKLQFESSPWSPRRVNPSRRARPADLESGYWTDTDQSDKYVCSPEVSPRSQGWNSINQSQSPVSSQSVSSTPSTLGSPFRPLPPIQHFLPTSVPGNYYDESSRSKRTHSKVSYGDDKDGESSEVLTAAIKNNDDVRESGGYGDRVHTRQEIEAAKTILQLNAADLTLPPTKRTCQNPRN